MSMDLFEKQPDGTCRNTMNLLQLKTQQTVNSRVGKAEERTRKCKERLKLITPNVAQSNKEIENMQDIERHAGQNKVQCG